MSKWEPRAGVSRRGNPYAGVGPYHVSGPKKPRKASKAGGGEMSDGAATFWAVVLIIVMGGFALLVGLGMIVALFEWNPIVGVISVLIGVGVLANSAAERRDKVRAAQALADSSEPPVVVPDPSLPPGVRRVRETWR